MKSTLQNKAIAMGKPSKQTSEDLRGLTKLFSSAKASSTTGSLVDLGKVQQKDQ